uniref:Uncharacterized protein n=1 Tax=Arundo donax TaxID=35708 RepID=A0A0A8Y836_ARUDO
MQGTLLYIQLCITYCRVCKV